MAMRTKTPLQEYFQSLEHIDESYPKRRKVEKVVKKSPVTPVPQPTTIDSAPSTSSRTNPICCQSCAKPVSFILCTKCQESIYKGSKEKEENM